MFNIVFLIIACKKSQTKHLFTKHTNAIFIVNYSTISVTRGVLSEMFTVDDHDTGKDVVVVDV